jgi:hypothetical protein
MQARGESIPQLIQISESFGIPSVGITDKDKGLKQTDKFVNYYQTTLRDFEEEFIDLLLKSGRENTLRAILTEYDPKGINRSIDVKALKARTAKYKVKYKYKSDLKLADIDLSADNLPSIKIYYLAWFSINKSFPVGKLIGENLQKEQIPAIYKTVMEKAYELAKNAQ